MRRYVTATVRAGRGRDDSDRKYQAERDIRRQLNLSSRNGGGGGAEASELWQTMNNDLLTLGESSNQNVLKELSLNND